MLGRSCVNRLRSSAPFSSIIERAIRPRFSFWGWFSSTSMKVRPVHVSRGLEAGRKLLIEYRIGWSMECQRTFHYAGVPRFQRIPEFSLAFLRPWYRSFVSSVYFYECFLSARLKCLLVSSVATTFLFCILK